jgi:putative PIN family toxin of toxin-antitoxin system
MTKSYNIIIDTNIWISIAFGGKIIEQVFKVVFNNNINIFVCPELLSEVRNTLKKPKIAKYISEERATSTLLIIEASTQKVQLHNYSLKVCRDPKDDYLLALGIQVNADYLITGDKDLLELNQVSNLKIIKLIDFVNSL